MDYRYVCLISVGCLALTLRAPADIVWSGEQNLSIYSQYIDLNSDSLVDLVTSYSVTGNNSLSLADQRGSVYARVDAPGIDGSNRILIDALSRGDAALTLGTLISGVPDASLAWKGGRYALGVVSEWSTSPPTPDTEWGGLLGENGNTYIGIAFDVGDSTHYAWVNIALGPDEVEGFALPIITSWAYESTPDTGIVAGAIPEPSTGILTIGGSLSLLLIARHRRRAKQGRSPLPSCRYPHMSDPGAW